MKISGLFFLLALLGGADQHAAEAPPPAKTACADEAACLAGCTPAAAPGCTALAEFVRADGKPLGNPLGAAATLSTACEKSVAGSCSALARLLTGWRGHPEGDFIRAAKLAREACSRKEADGCQVAGYLAREGKGGSVDQAAAANFLAQGCELGSLKACANFARQLEEGKGVAQDAARALALMTRACDGGFPDACPLVAGRLLKGHDDADNPKRAVGYLRRGCDAGSDNSCIFLAMQMISGKGIEQDLSGARKLLEPRCSHELPLGCFFLGTLLENGGGGPADPERALGLFKTACDGGFQDACPRQTAPDPEAEVVFRDRASGVKIVRDAASGMLVIFARDEQSGVKAEYDYISSLACGITGHWSKLSQALAMVENRPVDVMEMACSATKKTETFRFDISHFFGQINEETPKPPANGGGTASAIRQMQDLCATTGNCACRPLAEMEALPGEEPQPLYAPLRSLYEAGCARDIAVCCGQLGLMLQGGKGGKADAKRAGQILRKACAGGEKSACPPAREK